MAQPPNTVRARPDDVMAESFRYWTEASEYGNLDHDSACALLAMGGGETSFRWTWKQLGPAAGSKSPASFLLCVVGDHGKAFGEFQHQMARIRVIEQHTGIDISKTALDDPEEGAVTHWENLRAADWEISDRLSYGYKRVRPALVAAQTPREKVEVLVNLLEQSAHRERDSSIRFALFNAYSMRFGNGKMA